MGEGATATAKGEDVSGAKGERRTAVLGWTRSHGRKLATWAAVLFIASLFVPALTKQWNDRQQELEVKQLLLADIVEETTAAVYGAQSAERQSAQRQVQARAELVGNWLRRRTALETPMLVYFDESEAADHWRGREQLGFRNAVLVYILMSCCDERARANHVAMLEKYFDDNEWDLGLPPDELNKVWNALRCGPQESCPDRGHERAYGWLGNQLLGQRFVLRDQLLAANGEGFSSGWRDFIGDLNPLG